MSESNSEKLLDQSLAATFPASDPVSVTQPGGGPDTPADRPEALDRLLSDSARPGRTADRDGRSITV